MHSDNRTIDAVRHTFPDTEIYLYESGHAFANDARPTYVPASTATAPNVQ